MKLAWSRKAEEAVARVPFFVRKRVRKRVEEEALRTRAREVRLEHVKECKRRYLHHMEEEVKGCQVETCFGPSGCPNRAIEDNDFAQELEERFQRRNWREFLKGRVTGPLKMHHEFRISLSDCPNACSRPQIADIGLIGLRQPRITSAACSRCRDCVEACREEAISLPETSEGPVLDGDKCLACGQCLEVCPTGTLGQAARGYRILLGGKLGRHPQLGRPLEGIFSKEEALDLVDRYLDFYQEHSQGGERLGALLNREGWEILLADMQ